MVIKYKEINSWSLNRKVEVGVIVPSKSRRIFIMLHGYGGTIDEVLKAFPLNEYAEKYNMIIVIPELGNQYYLDRIGIEGKKNYIVSDFLCKELPNYIVNEYKLGSDIEVILGGYSMGGFGTMLHGLNATHCFKALISVSGAFVANEIAIGSEFVVGSDEKRKIAFDMFMIKDGELPIDVLYNDVKRNPMATLKALNEEQISQMPQIVMTCTTKDIWHSTTQQMKVILEEKEIPFDYYESIDGEHDFVEFDRGFRFAFQRIFGY